MITKVPILTDAGKSLFNKAQAGETLTFTRFKVGDGVLPEGSDGRGLTDLINELFTFGITDTDSSHDGYIKVTGEFDTEDIPSEMRFRELGLFAKGEDDVEVLYCYSNDGADAGTLVTGDGNIFTQQEISFDIVIGTAEHVTAVIAPEMIYATKAAFDAHVADQNNPHGVTAAQIGVGYVTPEEYGAKADGVTDDSFAFTDALATGKPVYVNGNYVVNSVSCTRDATMIFGPSAKIRRTLTKSANQSGTFEFQGTVGEKVYLTSNAAENSQTVTVSDGSGFAAGDLVKIGLDAPASTANSNKVLIAVVTGVNGNVLTISEPTQWAYPTAEQAFVQKITPIRVNIIGNGLVYNGGGLTGRGYAFFLRYCCDSSIKGITVQNSSTGLCRMDNCYNALVDHCSGRDTISRDTPPYGEFLTIAYSSCITARHIVTADYRRVVDYVGACHCAAYDCEAAYGGFSSHGLLARYCEFIDCRAINRDNNTTGISVVGNESYYYDKDIIYKHCTFLGGSRGIYVLTASGVGTAESTCKLIDCIFRNNLVAVFGDSAQMIEVYGGMIDTPRTAFSSNVSKVYVKGCRIVSSGGSTRNIIAGSGGSVYEECSMESAQAKLSTDLKNAKLINCNIKAASASSVKENVRLIGCTLENALAISDGGSHITIMDSVAKNITASGTSTYVLIDNLRTWDGTLGITTDAEVHNSVNHATKLDYSPFATS